MDKGYYAVARIVRPGAILVAIHNKNGQGLLRQRFSRNGKRTESQSTIKMDKGYYLIYMNGFQIAIKTVAIHNKNGQGLLLT